jgi:hypothetical protein
MGLWNRIVHSNYRVEFGAPRALRVAWTFSTLVGQCHQVPAVHTTTGCLEEKN